MTSVAVLRTDERCDPYIAAMSTPPTAPTTAPTTAHTTGPVPSTPDDLRSQVAAELGTALRELVAYGDAGTQAHEYAGGQLLTVLRGREPHLCRSRCTANPGPFPCSPGIPAHLNGMTRRPVDGTSLLPPARFGESKTLAQRVLFEYLREVAQPGVETVWAWVASLVGTVGARAVTEALADLAAGHDERDRYAWHACAGWQLAVSAHGPHPDAFTVVVTHEASQAGFDPEDDASGDDVRRGLAADVRPYVVCDIDDPYGRQAVTALAAARATTKFARLRGRRGAAAARAARTPSA